MVFRMKILLIILILFTINIVGQTDSSKTITRLELSDGSILIGKILSEDIASIQFITQSEIEITINKTSIKKRELISGENFDGEFWRDDPNSTRLFFAPTGKMLKSGDGYFSVYEIFFPFIAVGITDYLILSGGFSLVPGADNQLLYVAPKIGFISTTDFNLAGGILYIKIPDNDKGIGVMYSVGTYGNQKSSLSLGIGYGFAGGDLANNPIIMIGGELRLSKSIKMITENWIITGEEAGIYSFGLRFFGENLAADFGFIYPGESSNGFPFLPWIGFAYNF